jgi:hypothetical protein
MSFLSVPPTIVYFSGGKKTVDLQHNQTKKGRAISGEPAL